MSFGAGAAEGFETEDAEGNVRVGSGRASDEGGRMELYHRRHDPMAPGDSPEGTGGMMGRPTFNQAFTYHASDKFSPAQNAARVALGILPGAGAAQLLMAVGAAANDMSGDPETFGQEQTGDPNPADTDYGNDMVVQKKRVASTQGAAAPGTTAASGVKPNAATSIGGSKDSSPTRTRTAAGGQSTILTSPYGDLSQAPTAKKMLLGA